MPKRKPVKNKSKKKTRSKKKGKAVAVPKEKAPEKEKEQKSDTVKPRRKRKKKVIPIKLGVTEEVTERFETVFAWYRSEKENTATPNDVAIEIFESGLKTFESYMEDDGNQETGLSWEHLSEALEAESKATEAESKATEVESKPTEVESKPTEAEVAIDVDDELGYDPDFEEAFQNYHCRNF